MGLGGVAIVILPSIMCLKLTFSDGLGGKFANVLSANKKSNIIAQYLIMFFSFCLSLSPIRTYANVAIKNRTRKKK